MTREQRRRYRRPIDIMFAGFWVALLILQWPDPWVALFTGWVLCNVANGLLDGLGERKGDE